MTTFSVLYVGDVVGRPGRSFLAKKLNFIKANLRPNLIVVNGENAAGGFGLTKEIVDDFMSLGVDVITTGNHVFDRKEFLAEIDQCTRVVRPANMPSGVPGRDHVLLTTNEGIEILIFQLLGRIFMQPMDCPFKASEQMLARHKTATIKIVDIHAEATSEKQAIGLFLDGKVSMVVGTHTHVSTADHRVLPGGTAYITDIGMVGPRNSIIGMEPKGVIERFITGLPIRYEVASGPSIFNSVLVKIDLNTGLANDIKRIDFVEE